MLRLRRCLVRGARGRQPAGLTGAPPCFAGPTTCAPHDTRAVGLPVGQTPFWLYSYTCRRRYEFLPTRRTFIAWEQKRQPEPIPLPATPSHGLVLRLVSTRAWCCVLVDGSSCALSGADYCRAGTGLMKHSTNTPFFFERLPSVDV